MLSGRGYKTKADLKRSIGKMFRYEETSMHGDEYKGAGTYTIVGPSPYERKWYAKVTTDANDLIVKVS